MLFAQIGVDIALTTNSYEKHRGSDVISRLQTACGFSNADVMKEFNCKNERAIAVVTKILYDIKKSPMPIFSK